jgi:hypothetical protein
MPRSFLQFVKADKIGKSSRSRVDRMRYRLHYWYKSSIVKAPDSAKNSGVWIGGWFSTGSGNSLQPIPVRQFINDGLQIGGESCSPA